MAGRSGIAKLLRTMLEYYPNARIEVSEGTLRLWGAVLCGVPDNELMLGLVEYVREGGRYPPTPADLARICGVRGGARRIGAGEDAWLHEWAKSERGRAAHLEAVAAYPENYEGLHGTFEKCGNCPRRGERSAG